jgi:hypothetical protein
MAEVSVFLSMAGVLCVMCTACLDVPWRLLVLQIPGGGFRLVFLRPVLPVTSSLVNDAT